MSAIIRFSILSIVFSPSLLMPVGGTVEKLSPPLITPETILEKVVCTRPKREGGIPHISIEDFLGKNGLKKIVNCYGHGGVGWSTLFGSIHKVQELLKLENINKHIPIHIIGSGCMGLTAAVELSRVGYTVKGITTKELYDIPSWRAAGYFDFTVTTGLSQEKQAYLNELGVRTFVTYQNISKGKHPYLPHDGVRLLPVYSPQDMPTVEKLLEKWQLIPLREQVTLDFGNGVIHSGYLKSINYFLNTTTLMQKLHEEVEKQNIPFTLKEIKTFDDIEESIIINCSGLGAKKLNQDNMVFPARGHLIMLNEKAGDKHMNYMLLTRVLQNGKDEYIYKVPKNHSVTAACPKGRACFSALGGTFISNTDSLSEDEQNKLDEREFAKMLDRNSLFFHGHPFPHE
ncbi:MAG: FAD-dependent oxidoreductase [Candidatus Babeliaceae bacterium]